MIERMRFYWYRTVQVMMAIETVQHYLLERAYLQEAYDHFPGLQRRMARMWLKLALLSVSCIALARLGAVPHENTGLLAVVILGLFFRLFLDAQWVHRQDYAALLLFKELCEQSKFLKRRRV